MLELEAFHFILDFVPLVKGLKLAVQGLALRGFVLTIEFGEEGLHGISKKFAATPWSTECNQSKRNILFDIPCTLKMGEIFLPALSVCV